MSNVTYRRMRVWVPRDADIANESVKVAGRETGAMKAISQRTGRSGARWPGAQALEGTSQVIGFVSNAAGLEAFFPVLRPLSHVAPLCTPHVGAATSSDPAQ